MKEFFEALGIKPIEIDEDTVARLIEAVLPDKEEDLFVRQCYGICCQKQTLVALGRGTGLSERQVREKRAKAISMLCRSPETKVMLNLAEEKRWSLKDKDLQGLRQQVKQLAMELSDACKLINRLFQDLNKIPEIAVAIRYKPSILTVEIDDLGLTTRLCSCLKSEGIWTVSQLVSKNEFDLLRTPGFGRISLNKIKEVLAAEGLTLGMKFSG